MRYGIPDFKMEKHFIDRRVEQISGESVTFFCNVNIGVDKTIEQLRADYDAVLYCGGSENPRPAGIPGTQFAGASFLGVNLQNSSQRFIIPLCVCVCVCIKQEYIFKINVCVSVCIGKLSILKRWSSLIHLSFLFHSFC